MGADGVAVAIETDVPEEVLDSAAVAKDGCPVLRTRDYSTGRLHCAQRESERGGAGGLKGEQLEVVH